VTGGPTARTSRRLGALSAAALLTAIAGHGRAQDASAAPTVGFTAEEQAALAERQRLAPIHRWLGVATWAAMTTTVVLGYVQYHDEYGLFADELDTPCARGTAIVPSACDGTPWPHAVAALSTAALYGATATLSLLLPRPPAGAEHPNLALHKALRWIHLGGIVMLPLVGAIVSNVVGDFGVRQGLATWHLFGGTATWVTLTWAGLLML
jgi:hypothetical protein